MKPEDDFDEAAAEQLHRTLAEQLLAVPVPGPRRLELGERLDERVQRSARGQAGLSTVRREDGSWISERAGARRRLLRTDAGTRVELWELAPGARIDWPADSLAREILVLRGSVLLGRLDLPQYGHCVSEAGALVAETDSLVYVRHRLQPTEQLTPPEARWWAKAPAAPTIADEAAAAIKLARGVKAVNLHSTSGIVSMLVRVVGGASVPDHGHDLDEDCYVLEGDLFLSDILLREGDYQQAQAGTRHSDCLSEAGAVFYFRGALPH